MRSIYINFFATAQSLQNLKGFLSPKHQVSTHGPEMLKLLMIGPNPLSQKTWRRYESLVDITWYDGKCHIIDTICVFYQLAYISWIINPSEKKVFCFFFNFLFSLKHTISWEVKLAPSREFSKRSYFVQLLSATSQRQLYIFYSNFPVF